MLILVLYRGLSIGKALRLSWLVIILPMGSNHIQMSFWWVAIHHRRFWAIEFISISAVVPGHRFRCDILRVVCVIYLAEMITKPWIFWGLPTLRYSLRSATAPKRWGHFKYIMRVWFSVSDSFTSWYVLFPRNTLIQFSGWFLIISL